MHGLHPVFRTPLIEVIFWIVTVPILMLLITLLRIWIAYWALEPVNEFVVPILNLNKVSMPELALFSIAIQFFTPFHSKASSSKEDKFKNFNRLLMMFLGPIILFYMVELLRLVIL